MDDQTYTAGIIAEDDLDLQLLADVFPELGTHDWETMPPDFVSRCAAQELNPFTTREVQYDGFYLAQPTSEDGWELRWELRRGEPMRHDDFVYSSADLESMDGFDPPLLERVKGGILKKILLTREEFRRLSTPK